MNVLLVNQDFHLLVENYKGRVQEGGTFVALLELSRVKIRQTAHIESRAKAKNEKNDFGLAVHRTVDRRAACHCAAQACLAGPH